MVTASETEGTLKSVRVRGKLAGSPRASRQRSTDAPASDVKLPAVSEPPRPNDDEEDDEEDEEAEGPWSALARAEADSAPGDRYGEKPTSMSPRRTSPEVSAGPGTRVAPPSEASPGRHPKPATITESASCAEEEEPRAADEEEDDEDKCAAIEDDDEDDDEDDEEEDLVAARAGSAASTRASGAWPKLTRTVSKSPPPRLRARPPSSGMFWSTKSA